MKRYNWAAITLHWVMALSFFAQLTLGFVMTMATLNKVQEFQIYQWHKSLGVLLLLAFFLRFAIRLFTQHPALPTTLAPWEKWLADAVHKALYLWMLLLPLTGWLMVSSSPLGLPTFVFGWFEWPHIPGVTGNLAVENFAKVSHTWLAYSFIVLIGLHIAGTFKHLIIDKVNILPRMGIGRMLIVLCLTITPVMAADYKVDPVSSKIEFSGVNSGTPFKGTFEKWDAIIHFDPKDLQESKISVVIDMASAKTGNAMYDGTLPSIDWFDVKTYPKAQFESQTIVKNDDGSYLMQGTLKIREKSIPVKFSFSLDLSTPVKTVFSITLDRLAFDIGKVSDAKGDYVSKEIKIDVTLSASKL